MRLSDLTLILEGIDLASLRRRPRWLANGHRAETTASRREEPLWAEHPGLAGDSEVLVPLAGLTEAEGDIVDGIIGKPYMNPARSKTLCCVETLCTGTGRSHGTRRRWCGGWVGEGR